MKETPRESDEFKSLLRLISWRQSRGFPPSLTVTMVKNLKRNPLDYSRGPARSFCQRAHFDDFSRDDRFSSLRGSFSLSWFTQLVLFIVLLQSFMEITSFAIYSKQFHFKGLELCETLNFREKPIRTVGEDSDWIRKFKLKSNQRKWARHTNSSLDEHHGGNWSRKER